MVKSFKPPKKLAECADMLDELDKQLAKLNHEKEVVEERYKVLEDYIIANLPASSATGIQGRKVRVSIDKKIIPTVKGDDWGKVFAYIKKTGEFDLLQRRLSSAAVKERWELKKVIPGVGKFTKKVLKIHKLKGGK